MKRWMHDFVHNSIIHPILPFIPISWGDRLHEWHGRIAYPEEKDE